MDSRDMARHNHAFQVEDEEKQDVKSQRLELKTVDLLDEENTPRRPSRSENSSGVVYKVEDVPPWYLCLILGLQHYLTMFGGTISYPYLLTPKLCMRDDDPARGYIISTTFFVSGIATFIQATFGSRLPIIQGSTFTFLIPTLAVLSLPQWECPDPSNNATYPINEAQWTEVWQSRMREVQGSVVVASIFEVLLGLTGLIGFLLRWITPLGVTPIITLIGLSLFENASVSAGKHWGMATLTIVMLILFSEYMKNVNLPRPSYSKTKGFQWKQFPLFKLFPVLLTIVITWLLCVILTVTDVFPPGSPARTDTKLQALKGSPWFRFPYPGQWGAPTVSVGAVFGIMAGILSSAVESVGDYYACARMAGAPTPPTHAINRGICFEGIGCVLSGLWGSGNGLTSYSENIGAIGVTKVGSRRVIQYGAVLMILFGCLGKFGGLFVTMPEPVLGGIFCVMFAVITGVGLTNLQFVDLNSSRNLFILGTSLFMGMMIPKYLQDNPGVIQTGNEVVDQIFMVLLSTSLFVGGLLGILLDNTMPGTDDERGINKWRSHDAGENRPLSREETQEQQKCYDFPIGMDFVRRHRIFRYLPVSPTYDEDLIRDKLQSLWRRIWGKRQRSESITVDNGKR